ncbi:MAG: hypothetical protein CMI29_06970 [Opitutae bacterium]|nr:hypothetical protein [Bermanella sp.]MBN38194.1 hypothetical protein [Opitutae bacterium]|tara:strand:+ start:53309 stop:54175 length:867 start_codon:yes stop_codon:yes gene_type:complete
MIAVKIIADSIANGLRITTAELEYPRFIHAELMTHRVFSRNSASSRAIPTKKVRQQVWTTPELPIHWGANQSGMQAQTTLKTLPSYLARALWKGASKVACMFHWGMEKVKLHKQVSNRILETFQTMKVVVTSTEWANFLWLRDHEDAQPEIRELARQISTALNNSVPNELGYKEWHLPYITDEMRECYELQELLILSVSCCAQVSYRTLDMSFEKALRIFESLTSGDRVHASPFEHQATPIPTYHKLTNAKAKRIGVTHFDVDGNRWSGNFRGWIQHRQLIKGHVVTD